MNSSSSHFHSQLHSPYKVWSLTLNTHHRFSTFIFVFIRSFTKKCSTLTKTRSKRNLRGEIYNKGGEIWHLAFESVFFCSDLKLEQSLGESSRQNFVPPELPFFCFRLLPMTTGELQKSKFWVGGDTYLFSPLNLRDVFLFSTASCFKNDTSVYYIKNSAWLKHKGKW